MERKKKFSLQWSISIRNSRALGKCIWFIWQGSGNGGTTEMASVRSYQKPLPRLTEPMPEGARMDPPLAKAKPLRDGSNDSVIIS